jgi:hypothetical protein
MENRFFVEAKSFIFSVVEGTFVLGVAKKRKDFLGRVRLSSGCVDWLLLMVEEVLQNPDSEDFVKYFREGSKVTIVRTGGNSSGQFLVVTVFDVGGRRGMIVFPEGCDGRGWGHVFGELSKVLGFFGSSVVYPSSGAPTREEVEQGHGFIVVRKGDALIGWWQASCSNGNSGLVRDGEDFFAGPGTGALPANSALFCWGEVFLRSFG